MEHKRSYPWVEALLTVAVVTGLLLLRRLNLVLHPHLFAEDGTIFWYGNYEHSLGAVFVPYAGYLHVIPRLWAAVCGLADPGWAPRLYLLASLLMHQALVLGLFSRRIHLPWKPVLALVTVLVPHTTEVFLNLTNIQWVAALGLILLSYAEAAESWGTWISEAVILLLLGLTGPFSMLFSPLFLIRWLGARNARNLASLGLCILCALVQFGTILRTYTEAVPSGHDLLMTGSVYGFRVWGQLLLGFSVPFVFARVGWCLLGVLCTWLYFRWTFGWSGRERVLAPLFFAWLALVAVVLLKFRHEPVHLAGACNGDRYFYIPRVVVMWSLCIGCAGMGGVSLARVLPVCVLLGCLMGYGCFIDERRDAPAWGAQMAAVRERADFSITIAPGWTIQHRREGGGLAGHH